MINDLIVEVGKSIDKLRCYHFYIWWGIYGKMIQNYRQFNRKSFSYKQYVHTSQLNHVKHKKHVMNKLYTTNCTIINFIISYRSSSAIKIRIIIDHKWTCLN